jgi:hypothetical protein
MNSILNTRSYRTDDFRCHDDRLAAILPGRELESAMAAIELHRRGLCDGIFVQNKDTTDWSFLEIVRGLDRFFFVNVHQSFAKSDLRSLINAKLISISDCKVDLDLRGFDRLVALGYHWLSHPRGLGSLSSLRRAEFWGIGKSTSASQLDLPQNLVDLALVRYQHPHINLTSDLCSLSRLSITYARDLQELPRMPGLHQLQLKNVGRADFDYGSIPRSVKDIEIESCAPIASWEWAEKISSLERLYISETKRPKFEPNETVAKAIRWRG